MELYSVISAVSVTDSFSYMESLIAANSIPVRLFPTALSLFEDILTMQGMNLPAAISSARDLQTLYRFT